jgi:hypothetical protein
VRVTFRICSAALVLVALSACGGGATPPRTSPTLTTGVVGGRVAMPSEPAPGAPRMTVHIVGTALSAMVNSTGDFVLANVPAGPLELLFSGQGMSAGVTAGEIAGGETVSLEVRLDGTRAAIDAIARVRGDEATLEGAIESPREDMPANTIVVAGRSVTLPAGAGPGLTPGTRVRVTGSVSGPGIIARTIDIL